MGLTALKRATQQKRSEYRDRADTESPDWQPWSAHPGPQQRALESPANIIGYGGQAGGGKTALILIKATTRHTKSAIFRREYPRLKGIIRDSRAMLRGSGASYNSTDKIWNNLPGDDDRVIEFGAIQYEEDVEKWRGIDHDLKAFDELTEFSRYQFQFIIGWNRSTKPYQHSQTLTTFNPPTNKDGRWVKEFYAPWLDPDYERKTGFHAAEPGELRWFIVLTANEDGRIKYFDVEVQPQEFEYTIEGKEYTLDHFAIIEHKGHKVIPQPKEKPLRELLGDREVEGWKGTEEDLDELYRPLSRTFIPAALADNPSLQGTTYRSVLQSLPEPLRSQLLYGDFSLSVDNDHPFQIIPSAWVRDAQARWRKSGRRLRMDAVGVDVARGGTDKTVIARRHGSWIDELLKYDGTETPDGDIVAQHILTNIRDNPVIKVDAGGVGASTYDILNQRNLMTYNPLDQLKIYPMLAQMKSEKNDKSGLLGFANKRAEWWWNAREMLDPSSGEPIALPPGSELFTQLTTPRWEIKYRGDKQVIAVETKDQIKKADRLGYSPDEADAVIMALAEVEVNPIAWLEHL